MTKRFVDAIQEEAERRKRAPVEEKHEDRGHAKFAPSAASRWMNCAGSIVASDGVKEAPSSSYAEEGTECHEAAAAFLKGADWADAVRGLSEEQVEIVEEYTNYCLDLTEDLRERFDNVKVWIEEYNRAPDIHPEYGGTADYAIMAGRTLGIIDLKAGYGPVKAFGNKQLASYALLKYAELGYPDKIDRFRLTIVQPRVYAEPQTIILDWHALMNFREDVKAAIKRVELGLDVRTAGDHCKYCPIKGRCPELRNEANRAARMAFNKPIHNYTAEELAAVLDEAELIAAHVEGVRQQARRELEKGRKVPGYKLVPKRAVSKWTDWESAAPLLRGAGLSTEDAFTIKPRTPNQVMTALKKKKIELDLTGYFVKESSGPTLAREDDPREAVKYNPFEENENE